MTISQESLIEFDPTLWQFVSCISRFDILKSKYSKFVQTDNHWQSIMVKRVGGAFITFSYCLVIYIFFFGVKSNLTESQLYKLVISSLFLHCIEFLIDFKLVDIFRTIGRSACDLLIENKIMKG